MQGGVTQVSSCRYPEHRPRCLICCIAFDQRRSWALVGGKTVSPLRQRSCLDLVVFAGDQSNSGRRSSPSRSYTTCADSPRICIPTTHRPVSSRFLLKIEECLTLIISASKGYSKPRGGNFYSTSRSGDQSHTSYLYEHWRIGPSLTCHTYTDCDDRSMYRQSCLPSTTL